MLSQTNKAKQVRKYFLEVERLIKRYNQEIKNELYKEIGLLSTNQKPKTKIVGGVIYILLAMNSSTTLYKIGKTRKLRERLDNYNSGNANDIEPLFLLRVNDVDKVENCLKNILKSYQYRKYKEVYEIDFDIIKKLITKCDEFVSSMAKFIVKDNFSKSKVNLKRLDDSNNKMFMVIFDNLDTQCEDDNWSDSRNYSDDLNNSSDSSWIEYSDDTH